MKRVKIPLLTTCFALASIGAGFFFPNDSDAKLTACPNSGVKCEVTIDNDDYGKITVKSYKGKNDPALILE